MNDLVLQPAQPHIPDTLSDQRRRTLRQRQRIERGLHPLANGPINASGETCGSCAHCVGHRQAQSWYKCALIGGHSNATDIRLSWPACSAWKAKTDEA